MIIRHESIPFHYALGKFKNKINFKVSKVTHQIKIIFRKLCEKAINISRDIA